MFRILLFMFIVMVGSNLQAGLLPASFTGTPDNSWAYSELPGAGHGESISYFPTTYAEYQSAIFQGYVTYNNGGSSFYGSGFDSIQVFGTYVRSNFDMNLALTAGGDDGHSIFVNHVFVGGAGFGPAVDHTLSLQANQPVLVELVGYNGPGNWVFGLRETVTDSILENVPGIHISADGSFPAVPEPSTLVLSSIVLGMLACGRALKRVLH